MRDNCRAVSGWLPWDVCVGTIKMVLGKNVKSFLICSFCPDLLQDTIRHDTIRYRLETGMMNGIEVVW